MDMQRREAKAKNKNKIKTKTETVKKNCSEKKFFVLVVDDDYCR